MKGSLVFFKMFSSWQLFCSSARTISQLSVLTEKYSAWFYLWGNSLQATNMTNLHVLTLSLDCECAVIQNFLSWACALCCLTSTADCNSLGGCTATTTAQWLDMTPKNVIRRKKKVKLKFIWILKIWSYVWWLWNFNILETEREIWLWSCGGGWDAEDSLLCKIKELLVYAVFCTWNVCKLVKSHD